MFHYREPCLRKANLCLPLESAEGEISIWLHKTYQLKMAVQEIISLRSLVIQCLVWNLLKFFFLL